MLPAGLLPPPNRIFMFSTELANRAAQAVALGRVQSIVAYHMAQPQNERFLRLQRNAPDFMRNHSGGVGNRYGYGNFPGRMPNMDAMFPGGRPSAPPMGMGPGFSSMQQYQQYLKQQQQQQLEPRNTMAVDELQQMMFGPTNGTKGIFPSAGMPRGVNDQGGARPPFGSYPGPMGPGFGQQQMFMNNQPDRFRFPQPQNFPPQQQQQLQQQVEGQARSQADQMPPHPPSQQDEQKSGQQPQQQHEEQVAKPDQSSEVQQEPETLPTSADQQQQAPATQQAAPQLPVLSPGSSLSSSSPLGASIRSPPPYPAAQTTELNTLPGASSIGAPSPTNTNSPQTPHAPLTPRLSTSLASPKDGQRSPFSPGIPTSGYPGQISQSTIREPGIKMARQSPNLDKADLQVDKGIPTGYSMSGDPRIPGYTGHTRQDLLPQRPNSLNLTRNSSPLGPPPNKSPFLGAGNSPMRMPGNPSPMGDTSSAHHSSKFSVESLTAPSKDDRFYHPRVPMQAANPYAAYSQQPGLYYAGNKFLPGMLGQGQYQFPPHMQTPPQQFFPSNMPPQMYPPPGSFPIHHAGNRDGGI